MRLMCTDAWPGPGARFKTRMFGLAIHSPDAIGKILDCLGLPVGEVAPPGAGGIFHHRTIPARGNLWTRITDPTLGYIYSIQLCHQKAAPVWVISGFS